MGACLGGGGGAPIELEAEDDEKKTAKKRDTRKRNSQYFELVDFIEATHNRKLKFGGTELPPIDWRKIACNSIAAAKARATDWTKMDPRAARSNKIADNAAMGNMRTVREQVIGHFTIINRPYTAHWEGDTLLHIVCREGYLDMVEFMFNPKNRSIFDTTSIVVDVENAKWRTPLHLAFTPPNYTYCAGRWGGLDENGIPKSERPEEVQMDSDWIRPGTAEQRKEIVMMLIDEGADVNKLDFHNYSPLHYATVWGWVDIIERLISKGADPEAVDVVGDNCLTLACKNNYLPVVEWLVENTNLNVNARNAEGNTALFIAVMQENVDICECLLAYDADVNSENYAKKTPLKLGCSQQNTALVHMLLDFKAQRRKSAFDLLEGDALTDILKRLAQDDKDAKAAAEAQMKGKNRGVVRGAGMSSYGAWVPYLDKKKNELFYYNKVSREAQWEVPVDYEKDITYVVRRATYGMNFYH